MKRLEYSAGAVSKGFWFQEFKTYNELLKEGLSDQEIKDKQAKENFLMAPSVNYGKRMLSEVSKRMRALPESITTMFSNLSLSDQKFLNLLGLMMSDRLFFEFMYEVFREKVIVGKLEINDTDIGIFFNTKSEQSEKVLNFKSQTKKRLARAYRTYLREAGLLEEKDGASIITIPILDLNLEKQMRDNELYPFLRVFLGE